MARIAAFFNLKKTALLALFFSLFFQNFKVPCMPVPYKGMNRLLALLLFLSVISGIEAKDNEKTEEEPLFVWDLLWTGSWYKSFKTDDGEMPSTEELFAGGTLYNRGNISLGLPRMDLSFRFLATDKRLLPLTEDDGKAGFRPGSRNKAKEKKKNQ